MLRKIFGWVLIGLVVVLAACGPTSSTGSAPTASQATDMALKITGSIKNELGWSEADLRAMALTEAEYTNKDGETLTYTGVALKALLEQAQPAASATTLVMVADDGYAAEVALSEIATCDSCIVAFRDGGGLNTVLPGFPGKAQVRGVIELQIK